MGHPCAKAGARTPGGPRTVRTCRVNLAPREQGCCMPAKAHRRRRAAPSSTHLFMELLPSRARRWRCGIPLL
jgi:hypothetical protein